MTKAKGIWLCPTELREVAEATLVVSSSAAPKKPAIETSEHHKHHGARPAQKIALGICFCLMATLIGLHASTFSLSFPSLIETVSASQIFSENWEENQAELLFYSGRDFFNDLTMTDMMPIDTISVAGTVSEYNQGDYLFIRPEYTEATDFQARIDKIASLFATPERALMEQPVLASRSGSSTDAGEIFVGGESYIYTRRLSLESTAYTWTGNKTATGTWPRVPAIDHPGTIAVDPLIIPLGSKLFVDGYGLGIAEDTGGLIHGNIIDVYFNTREECIIWGRKYGVAVYVLK